MDIPLNKLILIIALVCGLTTKTAANEGFVQSEESKRLNQEILNDIAKATAANDAMSDEALLSYLKNMFKYMPEEFEAMVIKSPHELSLILDNFRDHHSAAGINIPELVLSIEQEPFLKEFIAQIWAEDTVGYEYAVGVLEGLSQLQYRALLQTGKEIASNSTTDDWQYLTEDFPVALSFLSLKQIAHQSHVVEFYLYRGIGSYKRAGFRVIKNADGQWSLDQFNYMESMDHQPINIIAPDSK